MSTLEIIEYMTSAQNAKENNDALTRIMSELVRESIVREKFDARIEKFEFMKVVHRVRCKLFFSDFIERSENVIVSTRILYSSDPLYMSLLRDQQQHDHSD